MRVSWVWAALACFVVEDYRGDGQKSSFALLEREARVQF